ncbi:MAG: hypothetical protein H6924_01935 [Alphaproteobacteria bacterium]|nr:hypothetical protein [Alphaproteobacteria bacterium]
MSVGSFRISRCWEGSGTGAVVSTRARAPVSRSSPATLAMASSSRAGAGPAPRHPAYLLRQPAHKKLAWRDLQAVRDRLESLS